MKIEYSFLTGEIYVINGKTKTKMTDEIVTAIQILLHNGFKFNSLYSKLDDKTYELILKERINNG